jgi:hypothetical protein
MDLASRPTNWSYRGTKESETMRNPFPRPDYMETKPASRHAKITHCNGAGSPRQNPARAAGAARLLNLPIQMSHPARFSPPMEVVDVLGVDRRLGPVLQPRQGSIGRIWLRLGNSHPQRIVKSKHPLASALPCFRPYDILHPINLPEPARPTKRPD